MSKPFPREAVRLRCQVEIENLQILRRIAVECRKRPDRVIFPSVIFIVFICSLAGQSLAQASQGLFSLQMNSGTIAQQPWPCVSFGGMRLWDSQVHWRDINTGPGVYDWTLLEEWLADAQLHNVNVLYTFGEVPSWASSDPGDSSCHGGLGACDPPNDLNPDGSGSDQHWKDFVGALVSYNQNSRTGHIKYWELWDEGLGNPLRWTGTIAQLIRMARDATAIIKSADPSALILNASFGPELRNSRDLLAQYLAAGGGQYTDVVSLHGYVTRRGSAGNPEDLINNINLSRSVLKKYGQGNRPLWDTEAGWGDIRNSGFTDRDLQAAFLARFYLLHWSVGIARFYWYEWNNQTDGALWVPNPHDPKLPGTLLKPGVAYAEVEKWIVGATLSSACAPQGTIWTCKLSRSGGYQAEAIWDTAEICKQGTCDTIEYTVGAQYKLYRSLNGKTTGITNSTVPIGIKPILVEN